MSSSASCRFTTLRAYLLPSSLSLISRMVLPAPLPSAFTTRYVISLSLGGLDTFAMPFLGGVSRHWTPPGGVVGKVEDEPGRRVPPFHDAEPRIKIRDDPGPVTPSPRRFSAKPGPRITP